MTEEEIKHAAELAEQEAKKAAEETTPAEETPATEEAPAA
jgi:hypothetical protein